MGSVGPGELLLIAFVALLVFGAGRVADIGKGVLFFPILESHGKRTALAYLSVGLRASDLAIAPSNSDIRLSVRVIPRGGAWRSSFARASSRGLPSNSAKGCSPVTAV